LLPDLQKMRQIATDLSGRFRDELAQRRFDDALTTAKTMFAMSRHMGEHPTLIGDLVGIAIAMVAIAPLEEMLQQPGCPNLYWALTNLPHPFLSLEKGMEGERMFLAAELRDLDHQNPMTPEQLKKLMAYVDKLRELTKGEETARAWVAKRAKDEKYLASARERLVEHGLNKQRLASFPAEQVILLDEERAYEVLRDEGMKYMNLPTWEALAGIDTIQMPKERGLFIDFLSAVNRVRRAQGRLEQRIALLRHVEALRLYAAAHEGKLPAKLADVGVPLPLDPFTGKPFRYEVKDDIAHVRGSPPKGDEKSAVYNIHYEITIRRRRSRPAVKM
jgi:hypothetical protein